MCALKLRCRFEINVALVVLGIIGIVIFVGADISFVFFSEEKTFVGRQESGWYGYMIVLRQCLKVLRHCMRLSVNRWLI